jgi:bacteriocin-like protein
MKTLFANNEIFATSTFELLSTEELNQVKGGYGPGDGDLFWDDDLNKP